ncbi:rhamnan synthesis F family protein [Paraburkholderia sp. A1RO-1]|uniref:rhamnan synthesis F family protein n=1 Tax=Paraburkholderia sp. A1RO-1 TaxID=3028368 RepID=UPI003B7DE264
MSSKEFSIPLSPASFWIPDYICQSAWIEHAPFAFWLMDALRPTRFVELGTHNGYSYFAFCQAIERLSATTLAYAIDTWKGDEHAGFYGESVYNAVLAHNLRYSAFSSLVRGTFAEALPYFKDKSIDLLHIDGRHFYDDVKEDFQSWLPKLTDDAIVLFHDVSVRERGFGVRQLFDELSSRFTTFEFNHCNGLGVIALGKVPVGLEPLFAVDAQQTAAIRSMYATLGQGLTMRRRIEAKAGAIGHMLEEGSDVSAEAAPLYAAEADWDPQVQEIRGRLEHLVNERADALNDARAIKEKWQNEAHALRAEADELRAEIMQLRSKSNDHFAELTASQKNEEELREASARLEAARRFELAEMVMAERQQFASKDKAIADLTLELQQIRASSSWRITQPLRNALQRSPATRGLVTKAAKFAYWGVTGQLPKRLAARRAFRMNLRLAEGAGGKGKGATVTSVVPGVTPPEAARAIEIDYSLAVPFSFPVAPSPSGRLAAIVHLYYEDLAGEIRSYLEDVPFDLDVFISTRDEFGKSVIEKAFSGWSRGTVDVRVVPNRGRDIAPKLLAFKDVYDSYGYVLHLHGKRSHHASVLAPWRHYLLESLCGNADVVKSVMTIFEENPRIGMIAAQHFEPMRHWVNWGGNFEKANALARRMGFEIDPRAPLDFPSGSMFWARTASLRPLLDLNLSLDEFDEEKGQVDATFAHGIERLYFHVCERAGYDWVKIARPEIAPRTPAIRAPRKLADFDAFFKQGIFHLLDPQGVRPREARPQPVEQACAKLGDVVRERFLGADLPIAPDMRVAIGLLTYNNSDRELTTAIAAARIALEQAGLPVSGQIFLLDNGNSTESLTAGDDAITRIQPVGNVGFGAGHNHLMRAAFEAGATLYIAVNPDGALHPDAIAALVQMVEQTRGRALVEALQFPSEHPKPYDPSTFDTPWVSGACIAIPKGAFEELGGFDDEFFMYCEDVDLSWRARAHGYALKTCPRAWFLHAVTNREQKPATLKMIFDSGVLLARKWGSPEFESWLQYELTARGFPVPTGFPEAVPDEWRRYADFSRQFSFAQPRW